jgi:pSer/pThr/pTyr-binding forkhead associated (FHA) protein
MNVEDGMILRNGSGMSRVTNGIREGMIFNSNSYLTLYPDAFHTHFVYEFTVSREQCI